MRHLHDHRRGGPRELHGGRGGRRHRMFESGELALVLLHMIEPQPRHGYDLIREIETRTGGRYAPSPGIVYPTLTMLEELGQIEASPSDEAKRLFGITEAGKARINAHRAEIDAALARLGALRDEGERVDAGPVRRAMQNLKVVLEQRLNGSEDKQVMFDIVDFIDDAARKIERL